MTYFLRTQQVSSLLQNTGYTNADQVAGAMSRSRLVICDAMHQPQIMRQAALLEGITNYAIIHLTCNDEVRIDRLHNKRGQPELANDGTCMWAAKLDADATALGFKVIDTGKDQVLVTSEIIGSIIRAIVEGSNR